MTCTPVQLPDGTRAIVCGPRQRRRKCSGCGRPADLLCDWKVPARKSGTCDKPICPRCSFSPAPDKDLCLTHRPAFEAWRANRPGRAAGLAGPAEQQQTKGPGADSRSTPGPETLEGGAPMHDLLTDPPGDNAHGE
jgi:hypothetical protein